MSFGISSIEISGVFGSFGSTSPQPRHRLHPSIIGALCAMRETATNIKVTVSSHFMTTLLTLLCKNNTQVSNIAYFIKHETSVKSAADVFLITISFFSQIKNDTRSLSSFRSCVVNNGNRMMRIVFLLFLVLYTRDVVSN